MSNVYKSRHFISKDERVRIPDVEEQIKLQKNDNEYKSETVMSPEAIERIDDYSDESDDADTLISKEVEEEITPPKILDREELQEIYARELKELTASVAQQAYFDALNKKKAEIRDCINGVQELMDEMVRTHKQFIEDYTSELKYMAVDIAEKMILEKISEDDLILHRLILQTMSTVKNAEWINVEISERLVGLVDSLKKELEKPEYNGRAFVIPVAGSDSICRVVTNEGAIVSTIEVQADNLRKAFKEFEQMENPR